MYKLKEMTQAVMKKRETTTLTQPERERCLLPLRSQVSRVTQTDHGYST